MNNNNNKRTGQKYMKVNWELLGTEKENKRGRREEK
jgi:hypothetical protein